MAIRPVRDFPIHRGTRKKGSRFHLTRLKSILRPMFLLMVFTRLPSHCHFWENTEKIQTAPPVRKPDNTTILPHSGGKMNRSCDQSSPTGFAATFSRAIRIIPAFASIALFSACSTTPVEMHPYQKVATIQTTPEQSRRILETIEKTHPGIHIEASLSPEGKSTKAVITVRTARQEHLVNKGFQKIEGKTEIYPGCQHWFYLTRNFDPACGGGKLWGTASAIFADGVGIGAIFDLVQLGRYPFTWTRSDISDPSLTDQVTALAQKMAATPSKNPALSAPH